MNSAELIARVRTAAWLETANVDFTDSAILAEMNDQMTQLYERGVAKSHQGYWLKQLTVPVVQGQDRYRMPPRAITGGLERVQIAYDASLDWIDLDEVDEKLAQNYELGVGQRGSVVRYAMRGDNINLFPDPDGSNFALRLNYYLSPSRITPLQTVGNAGIINAVNVATRTITFSTTPNSIDTSGTQTLLGAFSTIDVLSPNGWHEVQLVSEPVTISGGNTAVCTGTGDLGTILPGDLLRAAGQSEYPALPDDFHRTIADAAAVSILRTRTMLDKANDLNEKLGADLSRFGDLLSPRVQSQAQAIVAPRMYRGARRGWPVKYP